jgi:hypothetical protein
MRSIILVFALAGLAACCDSASPLIGDPDLGAGALAACPSGAEAAQTATCDYGRDRQCQSPFGYVCRCLCNGYWECDQVRLECDPDGGVPHD